MWCEERTEREKRERWRKNDGGKESESYGVIQWGLEKRGGEWEEQEAAAVLGLFWGTLGHRGGALSHVLGGWVSSKRNPPLALNAPLCDRSQYLVLKRNGGPMNNNTLFCCLTLKQAAFPLLLLLITVRLRIRVQCLQTRTKTKKNLITLQEGWERNSTL